MMSYQINKNKGLINMDLIVGTVDSVPIPVAAWSKTSVFCCSLAGIVGSNAAVGMDVCLF
jgi:hypothetical protein